MPRTSVKAQLINSNGDIVNPSSEETQKEELKNYHSQEVDDYSTADVYYDCQMKFDGTWLIEKKDESGNFPTRRFANISNNPTMTTYALAFANRLTLTYGYINTITI